MKRKLELLIETNADGNHCSTLCEFISRTAFGVVPRAWECDLFDTTVGMGDESPIRCLSCREAEV